MNGGKGFRAPGAGSFPGVQRCRRRNGGKLRFSLLSQREKGTGGATTTPPLCSMFHVPCTLRALLPQGLEGAKKYQGNYSQLDEMIGLCNYRFICYDC